MKCFDSVPTSPDISYYQQDGTLWHERLLMVLTSYDQIQAAAKKMKEALKHDERSRDTNDDLISYILGTSADFVATWPNLLFGQKKINHAERKI